MPSDFRSWTDRSKMSEDGGGHSEPARDKWRGDGAAAGVEVTVVDCWSWVEGEEMVRGVKESLGEVEEDAGEEDGEAVGGGERVVPVMPPAAVVPAAERTLDGEAARTYMDGGEAEEDAGDEADEAAEEEELEALESWSLMLAPEEVLFTGAVVLCWR